MSNLFELYKKRTDVPRFNKDLVDGLGYRQLRNGDKYLAGLINQIEDTFTEGLSFEGSFMADPIREVERSIIRGRQGVPHTLKMEYSSTYMVESRFAIKGKHACNAYQRIPFVGRGGECTFNGKRQWLRAVMIDRGINIRKDSIFIFLSRARFTYKQVLHEFRRNGELMVDNILTGLMHQGRERPKAQGVNRIGVVEPPPILYLLAELGATKMAKNYFNTDIKIVHGDYDVVRAQYKFPHVVYSGHGGPKRYIHKDKMVDTSHWHIVVKSDDEIAQKIAVNLLFLIDIFGSELETLEDIEDTDMWTYLAGRFIFNSNETPSALMSAMENHLERSINRLMDETTKLELAIDGIEVDTINELIAWLITNADRVARTKEVNSVYNKRLSVTRDALGYLQYAVTNLSYSIQHVSPDQLTQRKLRELLNSAFRERSMRTSVTTSNIWVSEKEAADNYWIYSRQIVQQADVTKRRNQNVRLMHLPENRMHASRATIVQIAGLPKGDPSGMAYIGPYVRLGPSGEIIEHPDYTNIGITLGKALRGR